MRRERACASCGPQLRPSWCAWRWGCRRWRRSRLGLVRATSVGCSKRAAPVRPSTGGPVAPLTVSSNGETGARGQTFECQMTMSDPRVSRRPRTPSTTTASPAARRAGSASSGAAMTARGPGRGAGTAPDSGTGDPAGGHDGSNPGHACTGTAGYERPDLAWPRRPCRSTASADFGDGTSIHGVLYEGPPPPPFAAPPSASE